MSVTTFSDQPVQVASGGPRRFTSPSWLAVVCAVVVGVYALVAFLGPVFLHYDPVNTALLDRLKPPGSVLSDGSVALLGTDATGRDVFAQVVYGARTSMTVGIVTVSLCCLVGMAIGLVSGYAGGIVDIAASRATDVLMAFPGIVLAIVVAGMFDRSLLLVVLALSLTGWISFARLSRASALSVRHREWVESARILGVSKPRIILRHVLPFVVAPVTALFTVEFGLVVIAEAGLSFLGIGLPSSAVSWGQTISNGKEYLATAWWISAFPGMALAVLVLTVGLLGDHINARYQRASSH